MTSAPVLHPDLDQLAAPFKPDDVEWKPGATTRDKKKGLAMAYLTSRAIQDRLDEVCGPAGWRNEFVPGPAGGVLCGLSVRVTYSDGSSAWVTKWDGADNTDVEAVKGGLSSAMKRAAVLWGIGRYLYQLDAQWVELDGRGRFAKTPRLPAQFRPPSRRAAPDTTGSHGDGSATGYPAASPGNVGASAHRSSAPTQAREVSARNAPPAFTPRAGERRVRR